jgi:cell wall-associated NlpC family hydrolase
MLMRSIRVLLLLLAALSAASLSFWRIAQAQQRPRRVATAAAQEENTARLQAAIWEKLGAPYRFEGTDDRGYDCSGFVWRVFQDAGFDFERLPARDLWHRLPGTTPEEARRFGTLVFFNDLKHVGIVRDALSFYHASRSQGVVLSPFAGYWGERITGYRRLPISSGEITEASHSSQRPFSSSPVQ